MVLRGHLHSPRPPYSESQRGIHRHHFHLHHRVGWRLRGSDIREDGHEGEELQAGALLSGESAKADLLSGILVDLLHLLGVLIADVLSSQVQHLQLCSHCLGCVFGSDNVVVDRRCEEMV